MKFNFEKKVIDVILNTIKKHQDYLTQKENLPQLAKLGYMYNTLWYSGRVCYGYDGIISKGNYCEDNPKYKIEMCKPQNETIENLIYDAWGMHLSRSDNNISWEEFSNLVFHGKEMSEFEIKLLKSNKTFEEWVDVLTDEKYEYSSIYPDRKSVANHLLCTIGTGYGYKDGFVIKEASGADQDITLYGDWENAKFRNDIQLIVDKIINIKEVKESVDASYSYYKKILDKRDADQLEKDTKSFGMSYKDFVKSGKLKKLIESDVFRNKLEEDGIKMDDPNYHQYYPICDYSIIWKLNKKSHPSYINAGIEICEEIIANENKEEKNNVDFAKKFLEKFNK